MNQPEMNRPELLTIGKVADRTGLATSAIRFYEDAGLVKPTRTSTGHRRFRRSAIRRLSFVMIAQRLGFRLDEIKAHLDRLPHDSAPTDREWETMARTFRHDLDARIEALSLLRDKLDGCIGCGCLSLERCAIWNEGDHASARGPGPRFVLRDQK